ncbi:MAG: MBOAT family protein [Muribaculaceae bacterium]|nr:MBOAT family protein [Muribaculaceae bacterium]MDE6553854.1 MBOAT family protein [Muribaculaceae bacterium]
MVFSDLFFIFCFIPLFLLLYIVCGWLDKFRIRRAESDERHLKRPMLLRNIILTVFSILFYAWGEPIYVFLMLAVVFVNYICGLLLYKKHNAIGKGWLFIGIAADLAALGSFKYLGFFSGVLRGVGFDVPDPQIALPIGISFYIFQSISYLVDVYREDSKPQRNYFDLLLYISMFPQLIAGPIVRYGTVALEIGHRHATADDVAEGVYRFIIGLGKKVIIANIMGEIATSLLGGNLENMSAAAAWVGILAFSIQIYFDFSGYSDMAIGIGRSVGFHFPENFNHPFTCNSMTDFWRRWHISLGSFFRDYVYIPMGGNRRHQALNILTVWFLTGMWHGASWNFIMWGLYFGLIILIEKYTLLRWKWVPKIGLYIYSIFFLLIGFGIFYFDDFGRMQQFFTAFFGQNESQGLPMHVETAIFDNLWLWVAAIILCLPVRRHVENLGCRMIERVPYAGNYTVQFCHAIVSIIILICSVALLVGATNNAFIYTRF